jgi:hypothetical protein
MTSHFSTGVFVGLSPVEKPQAPCKKERKRKKGEVLHLFRCYTHTLDKIGSFKRSIRN